MTWVMENLQIIATLGSAFSVLVYLRRAASKDTRELKEDFTDLRQDVNDLRKDVQSLDSRVARIEGHLYGRPYFEPKVKE